MQQNLRSARVNKGLSQAEAVPLIGGAVDTLGNYERGKSYPDVPIIKNIEIVYGISYIELIFSPQEND
ncbi:MAG: helix-turn-helix transcriptional regulator [Lachnospiraceae bacterium]